ncbi:MAG: iron-containing alcohol dehydrogenase [Pirellulaceae bacterium]|nr:iron-containing alcohol dehydrogenase [Pirellulaceae bacterium]MDP7018355.1 iron-containing alcohol dehydrogenase [Pirellulaceae bacterium]
MRTTWSFFSAGQLQFGVGAARTIGRQANDRQWKRLLIITDRQLRSAGVVERVEESLRAAAIDYCVFDEGEAEPSLAVAGRAIACAGEVQPDAILGLGGGSNMDLAKITSIVAQHGGTPHDYFNFNNVPGPVLPLICVPTTAGTGSEVSHAAVLTDTENEIKVSTLSQFLRPSLAVVDPELTYSCPPQVTADSGIDALTHAIEGYTATDFSEMPLADGEPAAYEGSHPLGDTLAEQAIELVGRFLKRSVDDGGDVEARNGMALAATLAGLAFSNCGVALVHALEYPLGGALHCSHGGGNGLLLPFVMQFNLPACQAKLARVAELLGCPAAPQAEAAQQAIDVVERLKQEIGVPLRINELGGSREQLPEFARKAFAIKRLMDVNPRTPTEADLLGIYEAAF